MTADSLYDDGGLLIDRDGLTIRRYYFPLATSKRIPFSDVRGVEARPMGWTNGRGRGWGSSRPRQWLPLDLGRPRKHTMVLIDLGRRISPVVTPDDPDRVVGLIRSRTTAS